MGEKNFISLANHFSHMNLLLEYAGTPSPPSSSIASDHAALTTPPCCVSVLFALFFSLLLYPSHISLPILPLRLPQRPQIPSFSIYLQMRLLSCHLFPSPVLRFLSLLMEAAITSILLLFRYKLVKTKEILKSHVSFWLHPPFPTQTCLTLPSKSPTGLYSFTVTSSCLKNTKMPISDHSGWEKKLIHQQWQTFTDIQTTSQMSKAQCL